MAATSRYILLQSSPRTILTTAGRVRSQGGRERWHSSWYQVQGWRCISFGEAHHQQAAQTRSEQEDSNSRQEHGHSTLEKYVAIDILANAPPRYLQVFSPMDATSSHELATKLHSGGNSTRHRSLPLLSQTAWAATSKHTLSTLVFVLSE